MELHVFKGKVVSQPVVVPIQGYAVALIVIDIDSATIKGRKKFFCQAPKYLTSNGNGLATTMLSDVVCSSIGDDVRIEVEANLESGYMDTQIRYFANDTLGIGNIYEKL